MPFPSSPAFACFISHRDDPLCDPSASPFPVTLSPCGGVSILEEYNYYFFPPRMFRIFFRDLTFGAHYFSSPAKGDSFVLPVFYPGNVPLHIDFFLSNSLDCSAFSFFPYDVSSPFHRAARNSSPPLMRVETRGLSFSLFR